MQAPLVRPLASAQHSWGVASRRDKADAYQRMPVRDTRRPCPRTGVCAVSCDALLFITVRGRWPVLACYTVDRPCVRSHSTCRCISTYLLCTDPCKQAWQVLN
jgi:hypothetical protein